MHIDESQLENFIIDSGLASKDEMDKAWSEAGERNVSVSAILVNKGVLSVDDLRRIEAYVLGIPFVDLKNMKLDFSVLSLVPEPIARNHNIIAFKKNKDSVAVAMLDIIELKTLDFIKKNLGLKLLPYLTDDESMKLALLAYQRILKTEFGDIIQREASLLQKGGGEGEMAGARIFEALLKHALTQEASDIHLEPQEDHLLVRYRIDGILRDAMVLPKNTASGITARVKVLANLKLNEKRIPQDGRFRIETDEGGASLRVSTLPVSHGEKVALRLIRESASGFTLESLGLRDDNSEELYHALNSREGLLIIAGPVLSGRTTTLYTLLDILNTPRISIATIEDPVEYRLPRVNQTQIRPELGFTFAQGLRAILRQDPDVIMVGEIRDHETAALALSAAHSGRLVLGAMTANSPAQVLSRFKKMSVSPTLLASNLKLVMMQNLTESPEAGSRGEYKLLKVNPAVRELILNNLSLEELESILTAIPE